MSNVQINLFDHTQVTLQLKIQYFRFTVQIFIRCALTGGPINVFHRGPKPLSASLGRQLYSCLCIITVDEKQSARVVRIRGLGY